METNKKRYADEDIGFWPIFFVLGVCCLPYLILGIVVIHLYITSDTSTIEEFERTINQLGILKEKKK